jgi:phage terminase large subunit
MSLEKRIPAAKLYQDNIEALSQDKRYIVNEGGSRSGKSYSIMQVLITWAINNPGTRITTCSNSLPHLKRGALRDFEIIIKEMGWYFDDWHNKTDNVYHFPNGSYIEFFGLEDGNKARGAGRDILFLNEGNLVNKSVFDQLDMRTQHKVLIDLNPSDFDVWCYQIADSQDAIKIHSTYLDNPFLPEFQVRVIERYKEADPFMWQVFGLGLRGASAEQVYTHYKLCDEMPGKGMIWYGCDFGYNVPSAIVKVELYEGCIYVDEQLYRTKLTTNDLIIELKRLNIGEYDEIYADAAEPKTIEEIFRAGYNIMPADKDVTEGIRKVKAMPLYITERSINLRKEFSSYKWKKDKNEEILDEPIKENDHLCDALRYAVFTRLKSNEAQFFMI